MVSPLRAWAYDFSAVAPTGQTLYYNIVGSNVTVTFPGSAYWMPYDGYDKPSGSLVIPPIVSYNDITYFVTSIGSSALVSCNELTSVTIPISVTNIGNSAFSGCSGLSSMIIPNSVTNIGDYAFAGCTGLVTVTIGDSVTSIASGAFYGCGGLSSVIIGHSVTYIGCDAFSRCYNLMEIICFCIFGPTLDYNAFDQVPSTIPIYIPCGSTILYQSRWLYFSNFVEPDNPYSLYVFSSDEMMGNANITTMPTCNNNNAAIEATPNYGYHFAQWNDGNTDNPRLITLSQDTSFTAQFARNQYTVNVTPSHAERGSVAGDSTVDYLDSLTLTATANHGYHFGYWSDGSIFNPYTIAVSYNMALTAYFVPNQYSLAVISSDETRGNVYGGGNYEYLSNHIISATANYGYHFTQWDDGETISSRNITLAQDTTFIAHFAPNQYTLTVTAGEHGTANGSGTYCYGDTVTIQAYPDDHYHFIKWNDNNRDNPRQYRVVGDETLIAIFAIDTHSVNVVSSDIVKGMVEATGTKFAYGSPCTVTATAYSGYTFAGWSNDVSANPYTFAVINDVELTALFAEDDEEVYTVTVESSNPTMGHVSGGGQALGGGTVTIRAIPNEGYRFLNWQDGNTETPRVVTVNSDVTYTAYFESTTQGVSDIYGSSIMVYAADGRIVVRETEGMEVRVFDVVGHEVTQLTRNGETPMLPRGVYLVKVGTLPAKKVVVMR